MIFESFSRLRTSVVARMFHEKVSSIQATENERSSRHHILLHTLGIIHGHVEDFIIVYVVRTRDIVDG